MALRDDSRQAASPGKSGSALGLRAISWSGGPFLVRFGAHAEVQFAAGNNLGMRDPGAVPLLAVEFRALDVDVLVRVVLGDDGEGFSGSGIADGSTIHDRAADDVD